MKGIISSGDRLTSQAGALMLKNGGNAYDAICAAMLTSALSEPMLTSVAGGGFLLSYQQDKGAELYDFFVDVPPNRIKDKDFFPIGVDFGTTVQEFHIGTASIAIPGVLKGIYEIHKEKGKLSLQDIIKPAYNLARDGFNLSKMQAHFIQLLEPILMSTESSKKLYTKNGKIINHTHKFSNPDYAEFLKEFAKKGDSVFYDGVIADSIDRFAEQNRGDLRKEDLKSYKIVKREPIDFKFRDYKILTNTTPSAGGILIAFALKLLDRQDLGKFGSIEHISKLIEAMVTTSDFRTEQINEFLHKEGLSRVLEDKNLVNGYLDAYKNRVNLWGNTTHISVLDSEGNAATATTTNGEGSGIIVPDCGIMLNNMLGEEDLNPHGFFTWESGLRLPSMMAPTIVLKDSRPEMVLGSAGSNRIRSAISQAILNYCVFKHDITEVTSEKRVHFEKGELFFEPGFDEELIKKVKKHYPVTVFDDKSVFFGGVNAVTINQMGGADPRRNGHVEIIS